jgi:alkyl hydroperoxide reductase subunit AhpC
VTVTAISVDSNEESRKVVESQHYTMPLLSDPQATTIRSFGVLHPHAGENGRDIARPSEFLVDADGRIRWVNLTGTLPGRSWLAFIRKRLSRQSTERDEIRGDSRLSAGTLQEIFQIVK